MKSSELYQSSIIQSRGHDRSNREKAQPKGNQKVNEVDQIEDFAR